MIGLSVIKRKITKLMLLKPTNNFCLIRGLEEVNTYNNGRFNVSILFQSKTYQFDNFRYYSILQNDSRKIINTFFNAAHTVYGGRISCSCSCHIKIAITTFITFIINSNSTRVLNFKHYISEIINLNSDKNLTKAITVIKKQSPRY